MIYAIHSYSNGRSKHKVLLQGRPETKADFVQFVDKYNANVTDCTWLVISDNHGWMRAGGQHGPDVQLVIDALADESGVNKSAYKCILLYLEAVVGYSIVDTLQDYVRTTNGQFYLPNTTT